LLQLTAISSPRQTTLLTLAGHDPSSGAGITADLQTFRSHGFFGTSAITALTVQSTLGVAGVEPIDPALLRRTLDHLHADLPPAGIKIGMLGSAVIAATASAYLLENPCHTVVFDPVLKASSGAALLEDAALMILREQLLPVVHWITPNWAELATLSGQPVTSITEAAAAATALAVDYPHLHIVATGGDHTEPTDLLRLPSGELHRFQGEHVETTSTHGTGCAFSSALLCRLVRGDDPCTAVLGAKRFVTKSLRRAPGLGHGRGPLDLTWPQR
jgi:hydroxymethylpyrimidine/phosphomethylpyrimidine kinase